MERKKARCGSKMVLEIEVPINAAVYKDPNFREYYISGLGLKACIIRYIDTGEFRTLDPNYAHFK